jgi:hypothetical protein
MVGPSRVLHIWKSSALTLGTCSCSHWQGRVSHKLQRHALSDRAGEFMFVSVATLRLIVFIVGFLSLPELLAMLRSQSQF